MKNKRILIAGITVIVIAVIAVIGMRLLGGSSHNGSANGANGANSVNRVSELAKGAVILSNEALSLRGSDVNDSETEVKEWAAGFIN